MSVSPTSPTPKRARKRVQGQRMNTKQRKATQSVFLTAFTQCVTISEACNVAGINRSTLYQWQEHDAEFAIEYSHARAESDDVIRAEIKRRAIDGCDEYVTSMGKVVYFNEEPLTVTKYSDSLLALLAKSRMPEFREKQPIDSNAQNDAKDIEALYVAIEQSLESYPDAKIALADAIVEVEKTHRA